jgi:hypothetical protein
MYTKDYSPVMGLFLDGVKLPLDAVYICMAVLCNTHACRG